MAISQADGGTRSGLLWEVERILTELPYEKRPTCLMLENVPEVCGSKNLSYWKKWLEKLNELGYQTFAQIVNAKDYGIPQNRKRCFAISIKTNEEISYQFPRRIELKHLLSDFLEQNADERFFLDENKINSIANWKAQQDQLKDIDKEKKICPTLTARGAGEEHSGMVLINENTIPIKNATKQGFLLAEIGDGVDISSRMESHRGTVQKGLCQTIMTTQVGGVVVEKKNEK